MADLDAGLEAPPPSPVASGRRSFFANDEILTDFLQHSLVVPNLILPDRVFPRQVTIQSPPVIDFKSLKSLEDNSVIEIMRDSISGSGCFQLMNYGIEKGERREALDVGGQVFGLKPEEKKKVMRVLGEREFGFEETHDYGDGEEGEREMVEEFVWTSDERLRLEMEKFWPLGYSKFSKKMEVLFLELEKIAHELLLAFEKHGVITPEFCNSMKSKEKELGVSSSMCYIRKQCSNLGGADWVNSIKYDVIKMLIRGSDYYSHALGLHVCDGCSEFHVYSKKGWVSFVPDKDALVVTVGDQIQAWSDGKYKNVVGRPICRGEDRDFISLAFLYSPLGNDNYTCIDKTISLGQQAIMAILFTFLYHFWVYIHKS